MSPAPVLVIGNGPGALWAVLECAHRGLPVTLLAPAALHLADLGMLDALDLPAAGADVALVNQMVDALDRAGVPWDRTAEGVVSRDGAQATAGPWTAFHVQRALVQQVTRLASAGRVQVHTEQELAGVVVDHGRVAGVVTAHAYTRQVLPWSGSSVVVAPVGSQVFAAGRCGPGETLDVLGALLEAGCSLESATLVESDHLVELDGTLLRAPSSWKRLGVRVEDLPDGRRALRMTTPDPRLSAGPLGALLASGAPVPVRVGPVGVAVTLAGVPAGLHVTGALSAARGLAAQLRDAHHAARGAEVGEPPGSAAASLADAQRAAQRHLEEILQRRGSEHPWPIVTAARDLVVRAAAAPSSELDDAFHAAVALAARAERLDAVDHSYATMNPWPLRVRAAHRVVSVARAVVAMRRARSGLPTEPAPAAEPATPAVTP